LLAVALALLIAVVGYRMLASEPTDPADLAEGDPTIEQLQQLVRDEPGNAMAWQQLGFAHFARGEYADAALAYRNAVDADPDSAVLWSSLGEARVLASELDPMPPSALEAFQRSAALDPADERARYFLAVNRDLQGDHEGAIGEWLALLEDTPRGAPWEADLRRTIEQVGAINTIEVADRIAAALEARDARLQPATTARPGPSMAQLQAAAGILPAEQEAMARGMVERLEARLASEPGDVDGWIMLMRSRMTLGEPELAEAALRRAIAANPSRRGQIEEAARSLGVG